MRASASRSCVLFTAVLTLVGTFSTLATGSSVITRDMLRSAGLTRVSDILHLIDDWALSTTDGYTWSASPNGLSNFQQQQWVVLLDGQRIDLGTFDTVNLNMLPVALDQIDSVVVVSTPHLHNGEFTDKGLIHFYTRANTISAGETYRATAMGGSKTGDPGPYRYTRYATPNVDAVGPDGSLSFGLARDNWRLLANAAVQLHYFTDIQIRARTLDVLGLHSVSTVSGDGLRRSETGGFSRLFDAGEDDPWPDMRRLSASITLGYHRGQSQHASFLGYSQAQRYFHYFEPFGRELPADNRYIHAGFNGAFHPKPDMEFAYRLQFSSNRLSKYENILDFDYDWDARRYHFNAELTRDWSSTRGSLGVGLERMSIATGYSLPDKTLNLGRVYGSLEISPSSRLSYRMGALATASGDASSVKAFWGNTLRLNERQHLETTLSLAQRCLVENNDLWYWTDRGYGMLDANSIAHTLPDKIDKSTTATADVTWRIEATENFVVGATGIYRYFADQYLEQRRFTLDSFNCTLSSPTTIVAGIDGELLGGGMQIDFGFSPLLRGHAYYRYLTDISGNAPFKEEWQTVSEHKANLRVAFKPYDDVRFWAMLTYLSSTYWVAYEDVSGTACGLGDAGVLYSPTVSGATTLDLKAQKFLLRRKLAADLICRNAWNSERLYHPVGTSFDLSFFFQLSFLHHSP